ALTLAVDPQSSEREPATHEHLDRPAAVVPDGDDAVVGVGGDRPAEEGDLSPGHDSAHEHDHGADEPPGERDTPGRALEPCRRKRLEERQRALVVDVMAAQLAVVERGDLDVATERNPGSAHDRGNPLISRGPACLGCMKARETRPGCTTGQ